jgi:valyl-tRNA synthetase
VLVHVLDQTLRLLHPYIPFVTEEIWQHLRAAARAPQWPAALIMADWPVAGARDPATEREMGALLEGIRAIRNARAEYRVPPERKIAAHVVAPATSALATQPAILAALARIDPARLTFAQEGRAEGQSVALVIGGDATVYLPLAGMIDLAAERARLGKALADAETQIAKLETLLGGDFAQRAPAAVVARERAKLEDLRAQQGKLKEQLAALE